MPDIAQRLHARALARFAGRLGNPWGSVASSPEEAVSLVNAAGAAQIIHAWAPGRGPTLTLGRKTSIADFVGGGSDGVLNLVSSFVGANGSGIKYDPAAPDRFTWDTSSMKVVLPSDGALSSARTFGFVGKMNAADVAYFLQSHDGAGGNEFKVDYGTGGTYGVKKADDNGAPSSYRFTLSAKRDDLVRHLGISWNPSETNAQPAMQCYVSRDHRSWIGMGDAGASTGYTGSRTWELGNVFGGPSAKNQTGDFRFAYLATGTFNVTQLSILNDFVETFYSAVTDTNPAFYYSGNSLVTSIAVQWAQQTLAQLGAGWHVCDLGRSGATWANLTARAPYVEALIDATKRTKAAHGLYEWTNSASLTTYPTAAAFYAAAKSASQTLHDAMTGAIKRVGITMLPANLTYAYNSANGISLNTERLAANALMVADSYWDVVYDAGADSTMGPYAATQNATLYSDQTHPTPASGTPIVAAGLATKILTL